MQKITTATKEWTATTKEQATRLLQAGEVVAFPTETVYGLGGNALDRIAVRKIFIAKNRPPDNPLVIHIAKKMDMFKITSKLTAKTRQLMDAFWPGPLTLVVPRRKEIPDEVTAGLETVAVRMPADKIALEMIEASGVPIAAPSANTFGKPSPTSASDVYEDMNGRIPLIIDGGRADVGIESTILSMVTEPPTILRLGGLPIENIENVIGKVQIHKSMKIKESDFGVALAPGMKYRHYSPKAEVFIIPVQKNLDEFFDEHKDELQDKKIGLLMMKKTITQTVSTVWKCDDLKSYAHDMFFAFRKFDREQVDVIIAEGVVRKGLGKGIMQRLDKAHTKV